MPWDCSREPGARQVNGGLAPRGTQLTAGFANVGGTFGFYSFFIFSFCFHCPQLWGPGLVSAITRCSAPSCPACPQGTLWSLAVEMVLSLHHGPALSSSQTGVEVRVPAPPLLPPAPRKLPGPVLAQHRGHLGCGCPGHQGWHTALHPPPSELPHSPGLVERPAAEA